MPPFANVPSLLPESSGAAWSCWHACGDICIFCRSQRAQKTIDKYRCCKSCISNLFCRQCMRPPPFKAMQRRCRMCTSLAMWCEQHCSAAELQSCLCHAHYEETGSRCQFCSRPNAEFGEGACRGIAAAARLASMRSMPVGHVPLASRTKIVTMPRHVQHATQASTLQVALAQERCVHDAHQDKPTMTQTPPRLASLA